MTMLDIFQYQDYRKYLKDFYHHQKKVNPAFSFRFFARRAELPSFNYLKLVMDGKRSLTPDYLRKFVKGLKLSNREAHYFETLVHLNQSKDSQLQSDYLKKLLEIKQRVAVREIVKDQEKIYSEWYHWVIREMLCLNDFNPDPEWISERLNRTVSPIQAKESLELLERLKLIRKVKGKLIATDRAIRSSDEVSSLAIKKLHEAFIQKALHALFNVAIEEREFSGLTIALPRHKIGYIKERIKQFRKDLNEILSTEEQMEDVYQLNLQFYPLTGGLK